MGAQNLNFAPKFPKVEDFQPAPNSVVLEDNFPRG